VDAVYVPTDNTVVSALESVIKVGEDSKIPVIVVRLTVSDEAPLRLSE